MGFEHLEEKWWPLDINIMSLKHKICQPLMFLSNKSEAVNIEEFNFTKESDKTLKILKEIQCGLDSNAVNYLLTQPQSL